MSTGGSIYGEMNSVGEAAKIVYALAKSISMGDEGFDWLARAHMRLVAQHADLVYLFTLEHGVVVEKMKLEYE